MNDRLSSKPLKTARKKRASATARRAANVSISTALIEQARHLGINLSQTLEERLSELVREAAAKAWLAENQKAIDTYNRRIEKQGVFSDGLRRF